MQLFGITKNMCSISVAPIMGGIIINDTTWKRIPDKYKPKLMDVCKDIEKESNSAIIELEKSAMDVMLKNGLVVDEVNPAQEALWRNETIQASSLLTGGSKPIIDRALFMRIEALLKAKRSQ
jgi:TRAP-type C4-dicarboxylate transport system substrate-binding protein